MTSSNILLFLLLFFILVRRCYTGNYHDDIEGIVPTVARNSQEYHEMSNGEIGHLKGHNPVADMISKKHRMLIDADESERTTVNSISIFPSTPSELSTNNHGGIIKTGDVRNHDGSEDIITRNFGNPIDTSAFGIKYVDEHSIEDKDRQLPETIDAQILQDGNHSQNKHSPWSVPISSQSTITPVETVVPRVMNVPPSDYSTTNIPLSDEISNPSEALVNPHENDPNNMLLGSFS